MRTPGLTWIFSLIVVCVVMAFDAYPWLTAGATFVLLLYLQWKLEPTKGD